MFNLPFTPRQMSAVAMMLVCFYTDRKLYTDKYWNLYWIFILFFGLSSYYTSYFDVFVYRFFGDFYVAFIACWATKILIEKYNGQEYLLFSLLILGLFDAIITIGQVLRIPFAMIIPVLLNLDVYDQFYDLADSYYNLMQLAIPGIFRSAVDNGHFLSVVTIASLFLFDKNKIVAIVCSSVMLIGSFMAQERAGFYLAVLLSAFILFHYLNTNKKGSKLLYLLFAVAISFFIIPNLVDLLNESESRFSVLGYDLTGRQSIWSNTWNFYQDNFVFGGFFKCIQETQKYPHNIILSAMLSGGIIGGLVLLYLMLLQLLKVKTYLYNFKQQRFQTLILSMCFISTVGDSFFHNISLVNADVICLVTWTAFIYSYEMEKTLHNFSQPKRNPI